MKKIGIVSVTNHNFGSILQTYALQIIIRKLGYTTQIIRYKESRFSKIKRLQNYEYTVRKLKELYKNVLMNIIHVNRKQFLKRRTYSFSTFINSKIIFSDFCFTKSELTKKSKEFSTILLGSDQVWHPMNLHMDFFTLNFVPDNIRKVAYASSFGVSCIPKTYQLKYKEYINRFQYLSCREEAGGELIKQLTGRKAHWVCDPTIILTGKDWIPIQSDKIKYKEKYIFCYFIGNNPNQRKLVKSFALNNGYKIVALLHIDEYIASDEDYADYTPYDVGPAEFLYLLNHSEYVMTDSFHATVFSLLFHKEFFIFNRFENGKGKSTVSRIDSLLKIVNLENRKIIKSNMIDGLPFDNDIDFQKVDILLDEFRHSSIQYLNDALA